MSEGVAVQVRGVGCVVMDTWSLADMGPGSVDLSGWRCSRPPTGVTSASLSVTRYSLTPFWPLRGLSHEGGRRRRRKQKGCSRGGASDNIWVPGVGQLPPGTDSPVFHPQHQPHEAPRLIATFHLRKLSQGRDLPTATQPICGSFCLQSQRGPSPHSSVSLITA